jgi:hypothetical protein
MKKIQIKNFYLSYDGMYSIQWENHRFRVFLELNTILKMLNIEGLGYGDIDKTIKEWKPIHFERVILEVTGSEANGRLSLLISDSSDNYLGQSNLTMIDIDVLQ